MWCDNHRSVIRDTCRIRASNFAANIHNEELERKRDSTAQKDLPTKKRYLSLLGFMMPSSALVVAFEEAVKRSISFLQVSSALPHFRLLL